MDEIKRPSTPEPTQAWPPPPRPAPEPTQALPPQQQPAADTLTDAEKRRRIEQEMQKLGLAPEEVRRLLNASSNTADGAPLPIPRPARVPPPPTPAPAAKKGSDRVTADSLQAFAAQLQAQKAAARQVAITTAGRDLPEFREASVQEVRAAETLLRDANMLRRREKYADAEAKCREALELTPKDGAALELLGDILQGVARVDEALAAYKRSLEADPRRSSAEKKYADLLMKQENWAGYDPEAAAPNGRAAVLLSACLPGAGHFFYESYVKGAVFIALDLLLAYLLLWSPWGFAGGHKGHGVSPTMIGLMCVAFVIYVAAIADTIAEGKKAAE